MPLTKLTQFYLGGMGAIWKASAFEIPIQTRKNLMFYAPSQDSSHHQDETKTYFEVRGVPTKKTFMWDRLSGNNGRASVNVGGFGSRSRPKITESSVSWDGKLIKHYIYIYYWFILIRLLDYIRFLSYYYHIIWWLYQHLWVLKNIFKSDQFIDRHFILGTLSSLRQS